MFEHIHMQENARHERRVCSSSKLIYGFRRIASVLSLAVLTALLVLLSAPASPAAAQTLHAQLSQDQISDLEQEMFNLINRDRAAKGLPPYTWDATLARVSRAHSNLMAAGCGLRPQCPGEPDPGKRISNAGIAWRSWGENVSYWPGSNYSDDIKRIEQAMINSGPGSGLYKRLMSTTFRTVGVGVAISGNTVWLTQDFVQP